MLRVFMSARICCAHPQVLRAGTACRLRCNYAETRRSCGFPSLYFDGHSVGPRCVALFAHHTLKAARESNRLFRRAAVEAAMETNPAQNAHPEPNDLVRVFDTQEESEAVV